jgi:Tol biopolymer transport system component
MVRRCLVLAALLLPLVPALGSAARAETEYHAIVAHELTAWDATTSPNDGYGGGGEFAPIISDDGSTIAFARAPGTGAEETPNRIFAMNADGSGEREVDAYTSLCYCGSILDVSADGSTIVSSDTVQLRVSTGSGGGKQLLALDSNEIDAVRISGDGGTIVFRVYRDTAVRDTDPDEPFQRGIYAIDVDGGNLRQIVAPDDLAPLLHVPLDDVPFFGGAFGVDVSADGTHVMFGMLNAPEAGGYGQGLFAVDLAGGPPRDLLGRVGFVNAGAISGDGSTIAYITTMIEAGAQAVGVVSFGGGVPHKLTDGSPPPTGIGMGLPNNDRIQLTADGATLLLGPTGLLLNTTDGSPFSLSISDAAVVSGDPPPLFSGTMYRATMDATASHFLFLQADANNVLQFVRIDLDPSDPGEAPIIDDLRVNPASIPIAGAANATVTARVTSANSFLRVGLVVLAGGLDDGDTGSSGGALADDGAGNGDAIAGDGVFTSNTVAANCCAVSGLRTVRVQAETMATDGKRHAAALDGGPFAITGGVDAIVPPAGGTPPAA